MNEWLGDKGKLATPYELMSYEYELCEKGKSGLNGIEEIRGLGAETYAIPSIQELFMVDRRTNTAVTHRDVGIGISQVLPVLVCAYASHKQILAMEQPEIHLHPALQAELADVFIESAIGKNQNTFILETHSEHLLLRMMRRMRETANGTQQNPELRLTPKDIIVLYVEPVGSQSIIREMPLNRYGELMKAWPGGFFEEGLREVF